MPETTNYLYLGLAAVSVLVLALVGSIALRYRNLLKDEQTLQHLLDEETK
jgi:hypothetical protein